MKTGCFSVIILCYRHFEYLFSAIDSVFKQDYEDIELVISDDGSPNFPKCEIEEYIQQHKNDNIRHVLIRQEETNNGTVKHLNHAVAACSGEYIVALAGDDALYNSSVLSSYVNGFEHTSSECYIEMAQTGMYDESLRKLQSYFVKPPVQDALKEAETDTSKLLYLLVRYGACLPSTSTCFRSEFFEKFGLFDEHYNLVEDYPMHFRLAEEGWKIHYENFLAIKHRHGGISHGQKGATSKSAILYFSDLKQTIKSLVLPHINILTSKDQQFVRQYQKNQLLWIDIFLAKTRKQYGELLRLGIMHPGYSIMFLLDKFWPLADWLHKKLLLICLALWFFLPTVSQMFETITTISAERILAFMYPFTAVLFGIWCVAFVLWVLNRIVKAIQRFPVEVIAIG